MKGTDRIILVALPVVALAIGFWLLVLGPKQKEAADLQTRIETAETTIDSAESEVALADEARSEFPRNYADVVKLGTAVPEDDDQATLIHDLSELARLDSVNFRSFDITQATAPVAPAATEAPAETESSEDPATAEPAPALGATPAVATEASAADLPLGATVGPAGLPVTPYSLTYFGGFFDMADLFADLDSGVRVNEEGEPAQVHGRLLTIDGFAFTADPVSGFPNVAATLAVTTYIVPADQGISAGATPAGPAPIGSPDAPVPVSTDPTATDVTATVTP